MCEPATHVNADLVTEKCTDKTLKVVIDEKMSSEEDVEKLGISAGDFISLDPRTIVTASGFIKSRHLDDKATALIRLAKEHKLNYAVDIYPYYGSDVETTLRAGHDIRHGLISPGVAASHDYERTHKEGVKNTLKLLAVYIQ